MSIELDLVRRTFMTEPMRFIVMHKIDAFTKEGRVIENLGGGEPPRPEIIHEMANFCAESAAQGIFKDGVGLHRSDLRVRLAYAARERTLEYGPYLGKNELLAACFMVRAASIDSVIERADTLARLFEQAEIEIGPVIEPWEIGLAPEPTELPAKRFLLLLKGNTDTERDATLSKVAQALAELTQSWSQEGILLSSELLAPSARGARREKGPKGKRTWTDGPFAESKELIAGFSIVELPDKQAALAWANRYAQIVENNEVEVREIL